MDDSNVNAVVGSAGRFANNNVAAGERTNRDPLGQLSAQVTASGLSGYTVVVYNDSTVPVEYTLTLENGMIVDDAGQVKDASGMGTMADTAAVTETATETATETVAATTTTATAATAVDMDAAKAAATTYTVVSGDTLGKIANTTYGDINYYKGICSFNELTNCNILEVGQELLLPEVAVLDSLAGVTTTPAVAAVAVTATATTTETVVAETEAVTETEAPVVAEPAATTLTPGEGVTYTVVSGDTLATIALAAYGDLNLYADLCTFNTIANCDVIEIGDVINLPALDVLTAK
jgi:nucleoid-associated protein YgaU